MIAKNHYRPYSEEVFEKFKGDFPETTLFTIDEIFGGWQVAQEEHFGENGFFDKMLADFANKK